MSSDALLAVERATVSYGGKRALCDVQLDVSPGQLAACIGAACPGETTRFNARP